MEKLFNDNINLAYFLVNKNLRDAQNYDKDDIYQEALKGLWRACINFNPQKNTKFSSFASKCILNDINMYFRKNNKILKFEKLTLNDTSILESESTFGSCEVIDLIEDKNADVLTIICNKEKLNINKLNCKEKNIIFSRANGYTLAEIATRYNTTIAIVRRIIRLAKIKILNT